MSRPLRLLCAALLGALAIGCIAGFAATREPLRRRTQISWRVAYVVAGGLFLGAAIRLVCGAPPRR